MKAKVLTRGADYWLVQRARRKDPEAWTELWRKNRTHLRNYLGKRSPSRAVRDDIEQQTALQAWRNIHQFRGKCPFHYWLFSIAHNELRMYYRKTLRWARERACDIEQLGDFTQDELMDATATDAGRPGWDAEPPSTHPNHIARLDTACRLRRIGQRLERMPAMYRQVWTLRRVHEFPSHEVAAMMKTSVPAVKSRLHRAARMIARVANG